MVVTRPSYSANGGSPTVDDEVRRTLGVLFVPIQVVELRAFRGRAIAAGYFDDHEALAEEAARLDSRGHQVCVTLNRVDPALLARGKNRIVERPPAATTDRDILRRTWLLLDFDPVRPSGISSTGAEKEAATHRARQVREYLSARGWPEPIVADSGNAAHLLYRVDLRNDREASELVKGTIEALAFRFSDSTVEIDTTVYNAARVLKLYGTTARKGEDVPGRPHRRSKLLEVPDGVETVRPEEMAAVARMNPSLSVHRGRRNGRGAVGGSGGFDLDGWIEGHGLSVEREGSWGAGGHKYVLSECPWNGHTDGSAYVVRLANGAVAAGCHHNSCQGYGWDELRAHYEPERNGGRPVREPAAVPLPSQPAEGLPVPATFPVNALPPSGGRFVAEASAALECPPELVAVPLLGTLSAAVGAARVVQLKRSWRESPTLYVAVVAPPGSKKTPAAKAATAPAWDRQAVLKKEYLQEREAYEAEYRKWETEKREAARNGEPTPEPPSEPTMGRTVVEDATVEALLSRLESNPRGILVAKDELTGWARSMDQYKGGRGADRQTWLSMWSNTSVIVDRKGRAEPLIIRRPFVSLVGSIQPAVLPELAYGREDGLLDRFLFAYPAPRRSRMNDAEISADAAEGVSRLYGKLASLEMPEDENGDPEPRVVPLSPDAWAVFKELSHGLQDEMHAPGFPPVLEGAWSKMEAYLARLALVLCLCRVAERGGAERVETGDLLAASVLVEYFKAHARRVRVGLPGGNAEDVLALDLARYLEDHGGAWRGEPAELRRDLTDWGSGAVPERPDELSKRVLALAARGTWLNAERGWAKNEDGSSRRVLKLRLKNGVDGVDGVDGGGEA